MRKLRSYKAQGKTMHQQENKALSSMWPGYWVSVRKNLSGKLTGKKLEKTS